MERMRIAVVIASALALAPLAHADIIESEPNNTFATADVLARDAGFWADAGVLSLGGGGGDVDFFSITLLAGEGIAIQTVPLDDPPDHFDPDTVIGLFDSSETLLASDDDSGIGRGSALFFNITVSGTYYIGISGFPDFDFVGAHTEAGSYLFSVKVVPAPAGLMILLGAAAMRRGRRRE